MASAATKKVTLKLMIDSKKGVVLFAEAGKDFVDFLFHVLALPVGTVVRLLKKSEMVGSLGNLYSSIESLGDTYYTQPKDILLKPVTPTYCWSKESSDVPLLLPPDLSSLYNALEEVDYYRCPENNYDPDTGLRSTSLSFGRKNYGDCRTYVSTCSFAICPTCKRTMSQKAIFVEAPPPSAATSSTGSGRGGDGKVGYVKGVVTYMVMEDLVVKPMSTISSITLLNKFNVVDLKSLEEKVVDVGIDEGVALLKASLESKTVLTDVFLVGKKKKSNW